jgi:hypothetical protein
MNQPEVLIPLWTKRGQSAGFEWRDERPVLVAVEALGTVIRGQMIQLSATSALIMPDDPCLLCNKVRSNVRFRSDDIVYFLSGKAISSDCDESIILDFDDVTRKDMAMLRSLGVIQNSASHTPAPPPPARVKRGKCEQRRVLHIPPPDGQERRIQTRHELETAATLVVLERGLVMKCTLLEVSLSGCRLFSDPPFSLPPDARVEVEFTGLGQPFRLAAEIKVKKEEHLLGLAFLPMSCRCQQRLQELTGELAEKTLQPCP